MKIRGKKLIIAFLAFVFTISVSAFLLSKNKAFAEGNFAGGNGTESKPYLIENAEQLADFAGQVNTAIFQNYTYFKLTADIDLSDYSGENWIPIGNHYGHASTYFTGSFDGAGHVIKNFYVDASYAALSGYGLFGTTNVSSTIKNLGIESGSITNRDPNRIESIGALAGKNFGTIVNCYNKIPVNSSNSIVGGLVGINSGEIINCYSTGNINYDYQSDVSYVGGVTGINECIITNCYNTGDILGWANLGGIAGLNANPGVIANCYSISDLGGLANIGGLVGNNEGILSNCYSGIMEASGRYGIGGVVGNNAGTIKNCFYDNNFTGNNMGIALPVSEMTNDDFNSMANLQDSIEGVGNSGNQWVKRSNNINYYFYPELKVFAGDGAPQAVTGVQIDSRESVKIFKWDTSGAGGFDNPFEIYTAKQLKQFSNKVNYNYDFYSKYIKLMADIDLNLLSDWFPIGTLFWKGYSGVRFNGNFDGNSRVIKNLHINSSGDYFGLFGCVGEYGIIKNLGIESGFAGGGRGIGAIAGKNFGMIENCYNKAGIKGGSFYDYDSGAGGIAGTNHGKILNCFNMGFIYSGANEYNIGGIAGSNSGTIENCYNAGIIQGYTCVGGITGNNEGRVNYCYNANAVIGYSYFGGIAGKNVGSIDINFCFYNEDIFAGPAFDGGNGTGNLALTTVQMIDAGTLQSGGAMEYIQNESAWVKRDSDGFYSYYPELAVFYNSSNDIINQASKDSVKVSKFYGVSIEDWTYGEEPSEPLPTFKNATAVPVIYYYESIDGTTYSKNIQAPAGAGKYKLEAVFTSPEGEVSVVTYFNIKKAIPDYTLPIGLTAVYGQTLGNIQLPVNFSWKDGASASVGDAGEKQFILVYTPADTLNFEILEVPVTVNVAKVTPSYNSPITLTAKEGQKLSDIASLLPAGFIGWVNDTTLTAGQNQIFEANYNPDPANYNTIKVNITVNVSKDTDSKVGPDNETTIAIIIGCIALACVGAVTMIVFISRRRRQKQG